MSLRDRAIAATPKPGRASRLEALRESLSKTKRAELDDVLADRAFSDQVVARVIGEAFDVAISSTSISYYRRHKGIR